MELLITIGYYFLVRLIFIDYKLLKFNLFWKFIVVSLYVSAALTEVLLLGQLTPYSKQAFVQSYVVQMAPEYGGLVKEVFAVPNVPVKKGEPLIQMDPEPWQNKVDEYKAKLAAAGTNVAELGQQFAEAKAQVARTSTKLTLEREKFQQISEAAKKNAVSRIRLEQSRQDVKSVEAQLESDQAAQRSAQLALDSEVGTKNTAVAAVLADMATAQYNLKNTLITAPSDGYVANLQLHPGSFVRLKSPIMSFVSSEEQWILAKYDQRGIQHVKPGDAAEVAFLMYPGKVFPAEVESVVWASGTAQGEPSGRIPTEQRVHPGLEFAVRLRMKTVDPDYPMKFGASGLVAIHSSAAPNALILLRQIEIRSESFINYLFNPF